MVYTYGAADGKHWWLTVIVCTLMVYTDGALGWYTLTEGVHSWWRLIVNSDGVH